MSIAWRCTVVLLALWCRGEHLGAQTNARSGEKTSPREAADAWNGVDQSISSRSQRFLQRARQVRGGLNDDQSLERAVPLFQEAAEGGNREAMLELANSLYLGRGVATDQETALAWYRRAADRGSPEAAMNLGFHYTNERTETGIRKAAGWYERADALGFPAAKYAQYRLKLDRSARGSDESGDTEPAQRDPAETARLGRELLWRCRESAGDSNSTTCEDAVRMIRDAAEHGGDEAMNELGLLYSRGEASIEQDDEQAVEWWRRAADRGNVWAKINSAWALATGRGVKQNLKAAFRGYFEAAETGNATALWEVGLAYLEGRGVQEDQAAAAHCFRRAAERGDAAAMAAMGQLYYHGSSAAAIERDIDVAHDWYLCAAFHGDDRSSDAARDVLGRHKSDDSRVGQKLQEEPAGVASNTHDPNAGKKVSLPGLRERARRDDVSARIAVAAAYLEGSGVDADPHRAFREFSELRSHPDAQAYLARCYSEGLGTAKDTEKSEAWLNRALASGSKEAMYQVGIRLASGIALRPDEALTWWSQAAFKGHAGAMYQLGLAWQAGLGVPRDDRQAFAWFLQSGQAGSGKGAERAATAFQQGRGVRKQPSHALKWFEHAVRLGEDSALAKANFLRSHIEDVFDARIDVNDPSRSAIPSDGNAEYRLGIAYREGSGVVQEPALAAYWLTQAVDRRHIAATASLAEMYADGEGVPKNSSLAEGLFQRGVDAGSAAAMFGLGNLCYTATDQLRDSGKAMRLFKEAAELGHRGAMRFLGKSARYGLCGLCDPYAAARWWDRAGDMEDLASMLALAELFEQGHGVNHDLSKALQWYRRAALHGDSKAEIGILRTTAQLRAIDN